MFSLIYFSINRFSLLFLPHSRSLSISLFLPSSSSTNKKTVKNMISIYFFHRVSSLFLFNFFSVNRLSLLVFPHSCSISISLVLHFSSSTNKKIVKGMINIFLPLFPLYFFSFASPSIVSRCSFFLIHVLSLFLSFLQSFSSFTLSPPTRKP